MKPLDKTAPSQSAALSLEFELAHSPAKVWRALTDPVLLKEWLLPVIGFELTRGAAFTFQGPTMPGWDGIVSCQMLQIEAQAKLSYAWRVGGMEIDTVVTFTLSPIESGTRLGIVQAGFKPSQKQNFGGARYGWKMMGEKLVTLLATLP